MSPPVMTELSLTVCFHVLQRGRRHGVVPPDIASLDMEEWTSVSLMFLSRLKADIGCSLNNICSLWSNALQGSSSYLSR